MKLVFWSVGSKHENYVVEGIELFSKRIQHYFPCEWKLIASPKNASSLEEIALREAESKMVLDMMDPVDYLILLDERGRMLDSPGLAQILEQRAVNGARRVHFLIGGAYGVTEAVRQRADLVWQLSKLVFPHQLVRLILAEQVYRACSIMRGEKYHHM
jgi:23S rRNA (pseudouridine1915-N3)-methyltransferase